MKKIDKRETIETKPLINENEFKKRLLQLLAEEKLLQKVKEFEEDLIKRKDTLKDNLIEECDDVTILTNLNKNKYRGVICYIITVGAYIEIDISSIINPKIKASAVDYKLGVTNVNISKKLDEDLANIIDDIFENNFYA